jgi:hypothetical protein
MLQLVSKGILNNHSTCNGIQELNFFRNDSNRHGKCIS